MTARSISSTTSLTASKRLAAGFALLFIGAELDLALFCHPIQHALSALGIGFLVCLAAANKSTTLGDLSSNHS